jgi:hypothetical protein
MAACFDHDVIAFIAEAFHQQVNIILKKRFAACDFNEVACIFFYFRDNDIDSHFRAFMEGIRSIAP